VPEALIDVLIPGATRRTGHRHPHLDAAFANYAGLLAAMGKSQAEIDAACAELRRPLS
jgi:hypothetical protein